MNNPFLQRLKAQPTLVQRIARFTPQPDAHRTGIDAYFGFDYMGASEFEWGTLPAALKLMRADPTLPQWAPRELHAPPLWFVGPLGAVPHAQAFIVDQVGEQTWRLHERSYLVESLNPRTSAWTRMIGWWALDAAPGPWTLFTTKAAAQAWLRALRAPPPKLRSKFARALAALQGGRHA